MRGDGEGIFRLYPAVVAKQPPTLRNHDFIQLTKWLDQEMNALPDLDSAAPYMTFVKQLERDYRHGKTLASPVYAAPLLRAYGEAGDIESFKAFWQWLLAQGPEKRPLLVWSSVMQVYSSHGAPLSNLEALFQQALEDSMDNYISYHASPNALLSDRSVFSPLEKGLDLMLALLASTQLSSGATRAGYLTLDTLWKVTITPTVRTSFSDLLSDRPASEAYRLYVMMLRSGLKPTNASVEQVGILAKTWKQNSTENWIAASQLAQLDIEAAALDVGKLPNNRMLTKLFSRFGHVIRPGKRIDLVHLHENTWLIIETLKSAIKVHSMYGPIPEIHAHTMLYIAAVSQSPEMYGLLVKNFPVSTFFKGDMSCMVTIQAAGMMRDVDLLQQAWQALIELAQPDTRMWTNFFHACKACNVEELFKEQLEVHFDARDEAFAKELKDAIKNAHVAKPTPMIETSSDPNVSRIAAADFRKIFERIKEVYDLMLSRKLRNFFERPMPEGLGVDLIQASEDTWAQVYERLTRDPREPKRTASLDIVSPEQNTGAPMETENGVQNHPSDQREEFSPTDGRPFDGQVGIEEGIIDDYPKHSATEQTSMRYVSDIPKRDAVISTTETNSVLSRSRGIPITSTGFRLDDIRYANWRSMNELILEGCYADGFDLGEEGILLQQKYQQPLNEEELLRVIMKIRGITSAQLSKLSDIGSGYRARRAAVPILPLFRETMD